MPTHLSESDARLILEQGKVGRLGCILNGEPYVVPINYYLQDDRAYSHSLPGLKIDALRNNPRACLQVDEIEERLRWRSALAFGKYEEIQDQDARDAVLSNLLKRYPMLTPVESSMAIDGAPPSIVVFCIRIERISGVAED